MNKVIKFQVKTVNNIDSSNGTRKSELFIYDLQLVDKDDKTALDDNNLAILDLVKVIKQYIKENNLLGAEQVDIPLEYLIAKYELQQPYCSLMLLNSKHVSVYEPYQLQNPLNPLYKSSEIYS